MPVIESNWSKIVCTPSFKRGFAKGVRWFYEENMALHRMIEKSFGKKRIGEIVPKEKWSKWPALREVRFNSDPYREEPSRLWDFRITINRHDNVSVDFRFTDEFFKEAGIWSDDAHLGKRFREQFERLILEEKRRAS